MNCISGDTDGEKKLIVRRLQACAAARDLEYITKQRE